MRKQSRQKKSSQMYVLARLAVPERLKEIETRKKQLAGIRNDIVKEEKRLKKEKAALLKLNGKSRRRKRTKK